VSGSLFVESTAELSVVSNLRVDGSLRLAQNSLLTVVDAEGTSLTIQGSTDITIPYLRRPPTNVHFAKRSYVGNLTVLGGAALQFDSAAAPLNVSGCLTVNAGNLVVNNVESGNSYTVFVYFSSKPMRPEFDLH